MPRAALPLVVGAAQRFLSWIDHRPAPALLLIIVMASVMGIVHLSSYPPNSDFNWENRWWQIALNVARGEGYVACKTIYFPFCSAANHVTAMREPLPVLLFALIARSTTESLLAAAAACVIVNLGTVLAVFFHRSRVVVALLGAVGAIALAAMWLAHLVLFGAATAVAWLGLVVVVQNILGSLFNSHLFDFGHGWLYVVAVGVAGGAVLRAAAPADAGAET